MDVSYISIAKARGFTTHSDKAYEAGTIITDGHTIHLQASNIPHHKEAMEFACLGFIPAGACLEELQQVLPSAAIVGFVTPS